MVAGHRYRAWVGGAAGRRAGSPPEDREAGAALRAARVVVEEMLELRWSPQQIAATADATSIPNDPEMRVSHETIYQSLFVQGRGALRKELHGLSAHRASDTPTPPPGRQRPPGRIGDMVIDLANDPPRSTTGPCPAIGKAT